MNKKIPRLNKRDLTGQVGVNLRPRRISSQGGWASGPSLGLERSHQRLISVIKKNKKTLQNSIRRFGCLFVVFVSLLGVLGFGESAKASDLLECNWDVETGMSYEAIRGGCFSGGGSTEHYEVLSGGPNERNFLRIKPPAGGSSWIYGHQSFDNPPVLFIRYWFRILDDHLPMTMHSGPIGSTDHPSDHYWIRDSNNGNNGLTYGGSFFSSEYRVGDLQNSYWHWAFNVNQWYLIELKLTQNEGATDSVELRIDGVDMTSQWDTYDSSSVADINGAIDLAPLNYIAVTTYDRPGADGSGWQDIAGLKITTGPDWIGGDDDLTPPALSNPQPIGTLSSGTTSTTISLDTDETAICKYSRIIGTNYDLMDPPAGGTFTNTNSTNHSTNITNLEDGNSYTYYVRCQDESENANDDDFEISFSVASSTTYSISNFINLVTDWLKSESGLESDVNGDGVVNTRDLGIMMSNWGE